MKASLVKRNDVELIKINLICLRQRNIYNQDIDIDIILFSGFTGQK